MNLWLIQVKTTEITNLIFARLAESTEKLGGELLCMGSENGMYSFYINSDINMKEKFVEIIPNLSGIEAYCIEDKEDLLKHFEIMEKISEK